MNDFYFYVQPNLSELCHIFVNHISHELSLTKTESLSNYVYHYLKNKQTKFPSCSKKESLKPFFSVLLFSFLACDLLCLISDISLLLSRLLYLVFQTYLINVCFQI